MRGLQAAGVMSGMNLNGALSAIAHASHGPDRGRAVRGAAEGWHARFPGRARRKVPAGAVRSEIRSEGINGQEPCPRRERYRGRRRTQDRMLALTGQRNSRGNSFWVRRGRGLILVDDRSNFYGWVKRGLPRRRGGVDRQMKRRKWRRRRIKLVRAGVSILTEKGFTSVGLDEILSSVGVPKGSFYYYFNSKTEFGLTLIDSYAEYFARKLDHWFLDGTRSPLQRLRNFVADARRGMERFGFRRGCLVGNLGQEMGSLPEPFRKRLIFVFNDWQARTENAYGRQSRPARSPWTPIASIWLRCSGSDGRAPCCAPNWSEIQPPLINLLRDFLHSAQRR